MSADRYEITDDGALTISIKLGENTQYVDELEDDFVVGAIRQQARDIAELEVFAEIGRQWNTDSSLAKWFPLTAERIGQDAQEIAKLRARLAAIEAAPTVATVCISPSSDFHVLKYSRYDIPQINGAELIARPAKDAP
jgi:hypothetical protein